MLSQNENIPADVNTTDVDVPTVILEKLNYNCSQIPSITWNGIKSIRNPVQNDQRFTYQFGGGNVLNLNSGFTSIRGIKSEDTQFYIYNEITIGDSGGPEFKCYTLDNNNELDKICKGSKPTSVVNEIFDILKVKKKRNWSGFEFFGLNRTDVIQQLNCKNEALIKQPSKKSRDANSYPELVKVASIQVRNAGKTDDLQHKRSKDVRNEAIHEVVKLASQDDVQSIEFNFFYLSPDIEH